MKAALDTDGIVSKRRTAAKGNPYGGQSFSRGAIYQMLQNRVYRGQIVHKGAAYPGEHPAIVDEELWLAVQQKLEANGVERRSRREEAKLAYLLPGVLFDAEGQLMTPTHAVKKGVRYRYYVSRRLITDVRGVDGRDPKAGQRLPAAELERLIVDRFKTFFADADAVTRTLPAQRLDTPDVKRALVTAADIARIILTHGEGKSFDLLRPLVVRAQVHHDRIDVDIAADRVVDALLGDGGSVGARPSLALDDDQRTNTASSEAVVADGRLMRLTIAAQLKRAGMEMKFVLEGTDDRSLPDGALLRLLIRANALVRRLEANSSSTLEEVGTQQSMGAPYAARLMRLNYLAPEIVTAILNGRQPVGLTASKLMADTRLPIAWADQRKALGFV